MNTVNALEAILERTTIMFPTPKFSPISTPTMATPTVSFPTTTTKTTTTTNYMSSPKTAVNDTATILTLVTTIPPIMVNTMNLILTDIILMTMEASKSSPSTIKTTNSIIPLPVTAYRTRMAPELPPVENYSYGRCCTSGDGFEDPSCDNYSNFCDMFYPLLLVQIVTNYGS